jgi:hypothetical protein
MGTRHSTLTHESLPQTWSSGGSGKVHHFAFQPLGVQRKASRSEHLRRRRTKWSARSKGHSLLASCLLLSTTQDSDL